ncbi:FH1/FH2 domain-containing protein 3 [Elysia marginata]|uniref:FH1/FH2 domain-containing protein 3 n=1 Tax=Elysia marginata TaxID=1093978 RepID=A0AAV4FXD7_9GAST|nr:FH1/FH2 domain-containing protein 3 [Elysia marginata]
MDVKEHKRQLLPSVTFTLNEISRTKPVLQLEAVKLQTRHTHVEQDPDPNAHSPQPNAFFSTRHLPEVPDDGLDDLQEAFHSVAFEDDLPLPTREWDSLITSPGTKVESCLSSPGADIEDCLSSPGADTDTDGSCVSTPNGSSVKAVLFPKHLFKQTLAARESTTPFKRYEYYGDNQPDREINKSSLSLSGIPVNLGVWSHSGDCPHTATVSENVTCNAGHTIVFSSSYPGWRQVEPVWCETRDVKEWATREPGGPGGNSLLDHQPDHMHFYVTPNESPREPCDPGGNSLLDHQPDHMHFHVTPNESPRLHSTRQLDSLLESQNIRSDAVSPQYLEPHPKGDGLAGSHLTRRTAAGDVCRINQAAVGVGTWTSQNEVGEEGTCSDRPFYREPDWKIEPGAKKGHSRPGRLTVAEDHWSDVESVHRRLVWKVSGRGRRDKASLVHTARPASATAAFRYGYGNSHSAWKQGDGDTGNSRNMSSMCYVNHDASQLIPDCANSAQLVCFRRKNTLILRTQLTVRVHAIIEKLLNSTGRELRRALFSLKQIFQDDKDLVHEFVNNDGLDCLIKVGTEADQNYQNYILRALGQVMLYVDGMEGVIRHNATVQWLYSLLASKGRLVVKTALKLLLVFVEYTESNTGQLVRAITTVDSRRGLHPWTNIMAILGEKDGADSELLVYTMTLVNKVVSAIPDQDTFYDVTDALEELGMDAVTKRHMNRQGADLDLLTQFQVYESALRHEDGEDFSVIPQTDTLRRVPRMKSDGQPRKSKRQGNMSKAQSMSNLPSAPSAPVETPAEAFRRRRQQQKEEWGAPPLEEPEPMIPSKGRRSMPADLHTAEPTSNGGTSPQSSRARRRNRQCHLIKEQQELQLPPDTTNNSGPVISPAQSHHHQPAGGPTELQSPLSPRLSISTPSLNSDLQHPTPTQYYQSDTLSASRHHQEWTGSDTSTTTLTSSPAYNNLAPQQGDPGRPTSEVSVSNRDNRQGPILLRSPRPARLDSSQGHTASAPDSESSIDNPAVSPTDSAIITQDPRGSSLRRASDSRSTASSGRPPDFYSPRLPPVFTDRSSVSSVSSLSTSSSLSSLATEGSYVQQSFQNYQKSGSNHEPVEVSPSQQLPPDSPGDLGSDHKGPGYNESGYHSFAEAQLDPNSVEGGALVGTGSSLQDKQRWSSSGEVQPAGKPVENGSDPAPAAPSQVKGLVNKLKGSVMEDAASKIPMRPAGDSSGLISAAKEGLNQRQQVPAKPPQPEPQPEKKTESELQWDRIQRRLKRQLMIKDMDFTDLRDEDDDDKNKKTVRLHWRALGGVENPHPAVKDTGIIWKQLLPIKIDTDKLEHLFETRASEIKSKKMCDSTGKKEITVLDSKRSNTINIGLTVLPPPRTIKAAILKMDNSIMNKEGIEKILTTMIPTEEEKSKILEAQMANPDIPLGTAEQFLLTLSSVFELEARLKLWLFKLDYENAEQEIAEPLMDLKKGIVELQKNKTFRCILSGILAIGNFLNGAAIHAFSIEFLQRVPEIKDTVHKHSLLHHLCVLILEQFPDSSDLYSEIGPITRCSRVDWDELTTKLHKMEYDCKASWDHLRAIVKHDGSSTDLKGKMSLFLADAAERIMILHIVHKRIVNRYNKMLLYLGFQVHDARDMKMNHFCKVVSEFALEYRTTRDKVQQMLEKKANQRERKKTRGKMIVDTENFKGKDAGKDDALQAILKNGYTSADERGLPGQRSRRKLDARSMGSRASGLTTDSDMYDTGDDELLEACVRTATAPSSKPQKERRRSRSQRKSCPCYTAPQTQDPEVHATRAHKPKVRATRAYKPNTPNSSANYCNMIDSQCDPSDMQLLTFVPSDQQIKSVHKNITWEESQASP